MRSFGLTHLNRSMSSTFSTARSFADEMDLKDPLRRFRSEFHIPPHSTDKSRPSIYLCGNSLGLLNKRSERYVQEEMQKWKDLGVEGHFNGERPWACIEDTVTGHMADIVGAMPAEIAVMNSLTVNLHLLMLPFYQPSEQRFKIICEHKPFPSDLHAFSSQIRLHDRNPSEALIGVKPSDSTREYLSTKEIIDAIEEHGDSTSIVLFSGVQYYTGQFFDIPAIVKAGHRKGCIVGFDLAHAVGNVPLKLHDWGVDFACWCSYKYLNSGPGGVAGIFVHERHAGRADLKRLDGWWGQKMKDRFNMDSEHQPLNGAGSFQLSNPAVLPMVSLLGSLEIFTEAGGMKTLREKSLALTGYLEHLLVELVGDKLKIITPRSPNDRGCQLSLFFENVEKAHAYLTDNGVICDIRRPNVIRIAPNPLYNSFADVYDFVQLLIQALEQN